MVSIITGVGLFAMIIVTLLAYGVLWYNYDQNTRRIFTVWIIFSVTIALLPLIFDGIVETYLIKESSIEWTRILARGELLIVSVAIGSEAIGRIVLSGKSDRVSRIIPSGICFVLVMFSSSLFAYVSRPTEIPVIIDNVSTISSVMFLMTMISSGSCVLLAEV